jgi:hypothetical protein
MKNKRKRVFWGFFSLDYKAMGEYLEEMAEKGWMVEKVGRYTAKFRAIEPKNIKFYVDVFKEGGTLTPDNNKELVEYRKLCRESGWTFITSQEYLQFFYAVEDSEPIPIQTDEEIEQKIVENTLLRREMINILIILLASIIVFIIIFPIRYSNLLSFIGVTATFLFPILFIFTATSAIYSIIWMIKARRNIKNGLPIAKPTLKSARRRIFAFSGSSLIIILLFILALVADVFFELEHLIFLLSTVVGLIVGTGMRNLVKKNKIKEDKIVLNTVIAMIMVIIFMRMVNTFIIEKSEDIHKMDSIPEEYPIITLKEISKSSQIGELSREFRPSMSPIVPKHYTYYEYENLGHSARSIRIKYYEAIKPYFADIIFKGITKELEKGMKWQGMTLFSKNIITDDEMKNLWDMDNMALTEERDELIIQKGNIVLHVDNYSRIMDFNDKEIRALIISRFFPDSPVGN